MGIALPAKGVLGGAPRPSAPEREGKRKRESVKRAVVKGMSFRANMPGFASYLLYLLPELP